MYKANTGKTSTGEASTDKSSTEKATQYASVLPKVIDFAKQAGEAILTIYEQSDFDIQTKVDKSPVTRADFAAHAILTDGLNSLELGPVLSEEDASASWHERQQWRRYWLVDPLDGTKEFIKRNDQFTVNIALIENGKPILGVIYAPVSKVLYYASKGGGAYKEAHESQSKLEAKAPPNGERPWIITISNSFPSPLVNEFIEHYKPYELMHLGSSLKMCLVAEGKADIYPRLGPTSEWDTAAAQVIVEEAGAKLVNANTHEPLRYNQKESLLNPHFLVCASTEILV